MSEQRYGYFAGCSASAKHKKNGSKSKKCSLPSDGLTQAQWKKRNGAVMEYKLNEPISYEMFKNYPKDLRKKYIEILRDEHGASAASVREMFGVSKGTIYNAITKELGVTFRAGPQSDEDRLKWDIFLHGASTEEPDLCEPEVPSEDDTILPEQEKPSGMTMSRFSLSFVGAIDVNAIANSLRRIIGGQTNASIDIVVNNISPLVG